MIIIKFLIVRLFKSYYRQEFLVSKVLNNLPDEPPIDDTATAVSSSVIYHETDLDWIDEDEENAGNGDESKDEGDD